VTGDGDRFFLFVGECGFGGVDVWVEFTSDDESGAGGGVGDEIDDCLVGGQRAAAPVKGDAGEQSVFDLVPFGGAGWVVGDGDGQSGGCGESGEFGFPPPGPVTVGSTAVSGDE